MLELLGLFLVLFILVSVISMVVHRSRPKPESPIDELFGGKR